MNVLLSGGKDDKILFMLTEYIFSRKHVCVKWVELRCLIPNTFKGPEERAIHEPKNETECYDDASSV